MHMNYETQIEFKKNKLNDILKKFGDIDLNVNFVLCDSEFNYRDKITLKVENNKLCYHMCKTNKVIEIDKCLLANKIINEKIKIIKDIKDFKSCYEISIRNVNSDKTAITFYLHNDNETLNFKDDNSIINYITENNSFICEDKSKIIGKINKYKYYISPQSFFQINIKQTVKILEDIKKYLTGKGKTLLDLYCGTGSIGIYMSDIYKNVLGIEICKPAIEDAKKNVTLNGLTNMNFFCGDTEKLIKNVKTNFDTLIVDPPRSGLTKHVIEDIFRILPKNLIYISCDPITLARDLKILKNNYNILNITGYDMFPNTYHVESVCILEKMN